MPIPLSSLYQLINIKETELRILEDNIIPMANRPDIRPLLLKGEPPQEWLNFLKEIEELKEEIYRLHIMMALSLNIDIDK